MGVVVSCRLLPGEIRRIDSRFFGCGGGPCFLQAVVMIRKGSECDGDFFVYRVFSACCCSTLKRSSSSSSFLTSHFLLHAPWAWSRRRRQKEEGYFSAGLAIISAYSASSRSPLFWPAPLSLSDELFSVGSGEEHNVLKGYLCCGR